MNEFNRSDVSLFTRGFNILDLTRNHVGRWISLSTKLRKKANEFSGSIYIEALGLGPIWSLKIDANGNL